MFKIKKVKPVVAIKRAERFVKNKVERPVKKKETKSNSLFFVKKAKGFFDKIKANKLSEKSERLKPRPAKLSEKPSLFSEKEEFVGEVTHFFSKISVCVIKLKKDISVGDKIYFRGNTCHFDQKITSMQVDHQNVEKASKGQEIGLKVSEDVKVGVQVFRRG
ncbi:MAG: hypothetical protein PHY73_07510 [Candidatus Omnitrophica bacterium]|nr:hypothetical protein [Candidatus Omnitrophota bacterium]